MGYPAFNSGALIPSIAARRASEEQMVRFSAARRKA